MRETFQISLCFGLLLAGFQFIISLIFMSESGWDKIVVNVALFFFLGLLIGAIISYFKTSKINRLQIHLRENEKILIEDYGELKDNQRFKKGRILLTDHRIIFERQSIRNGVEKAEIPYYEVKSWCTENSRLGQRLIIETGYTSFIFHVSQLDNWKEELGFRFEKSY